MERCENYHFSCTDSSTSPLYDCTIKWRNNLEIIPNFEKKRGVDAHGSSVSSLCLSHHPLRLHLVTFLVENSRCLLYVYSRNWGWLSKSTDGPKITQACIDIVGIRCNLRCLRVVFMCHGLEYAILLMFSVIFSVMWSSMHWVIGHSWTLPDSQQEESVHKENWMICR